MFSFIKNAFHELEHVVWPTKKEITTYMKHVVFVIIFLAIYLTVMWEIFTTSIDMWRKKVQELYPNTSQVNTQSQNATQADLENILNNIQINTGSTSKTGATTPIVPNATSTGTGINLVPSTAE